MKRMGILLFLALALSGCAQSEIQTPELPPKTVLTVLFGQSNSDPGLEDMLTDKILAEFPELSLEWESVDWGDYFAAEMQAKIASGEVPDLIIGKAQDVPAYQSSRYLASFDESFYGRIQERALDSVTVGGTVYGLPYNACYQGVIYNKNIFRQYGLEVPETLDEMEEVIARLGEAGVTPFASHFRENWYVGNITMQFAANQVFLKNPSWGDEFRAGLQSFGKSEEYANCFRQVDAIYQNTWPDALTVNQYECAKRFVNGEAAMYLTGSWSVQALYALQPDMQIGIFPYPNQDGTAQLLLEPNLTFMKNAYSSNSGMVDDILRSIYSDSELARTACAFTQTESLLKDVETDSLRQLRDSIDRYTADGRILDVTVGNRQLVWTFQDACASRIYDWLEGKIEFEEVLRFADSNRSQSA